MNIPDDNKAVYWLLMRVMFHAKHHMHELAEVYGLNMMQAHALHMLKKDEPLAMNALSSSLMCDASSITGIVDRLEAQGLVERRDNAKDRRVKMIALTAKGLALQETLTSEMLKIEADRLHPLLTDDERTTLREILEKLVVE